MKASYVSMSLAAGLIALFTSGCTSETSGYCESDKDCPSGERCNTELNRCEPPSPDGGADGATDAPRPEGGTDLKPDQESKLKNGDPCTEGGACESGFCVDGVCCDGVCDEPCRSCKLPGTEGTCTLAGAGEDPDKDCAGTDPACGGTCDGQGQCSYPDTTTSCGAPSCTGGELVTKACDGTGACLDDKKSCGGFACNAAGDACKTSCTDKTDCVGAFECVGGVCSSPQPLGSPCGTNDKACQSGLCRDGFCCDTDCKSACKACNIGGKEGTCSPKPDGTTCGATSCTGSDKTEKKCKAGACSDVKTSCGQFKCDSKTQDCFAACKTDAQCVAAAYCKATVCAKKEADGYKPCSGGNQCASGHCVGSVCCASACTPPSACVDGATSSTTTVKSCATGTCQSTSKSCGNYKCNTGKTACRTSCTSDAHCVTGLFCISGKCQKKPNGTSCAADSECLSNHCVGTTSKVCCATACVIGPCQSCTSGTCTPVAAGTTCNGGTLACVNLAGKSYVSRLQCNGKDPSCNPQEYQNCGNYTCAGTACRTTCTSHAHCVPGVCDLADIYGTKNRCAAAADICHGATTGTATQDCLNGTEKYVAQPSGAFNVALTIGRTVELVAPGTTGSLISNNTINPAAVNALLQINASTPVITIGGGANTKVFIHGLELSRVSGTGPLVDLSVAGTSVQLQTCYLHGTPGGSAVGFTTTGNLTLTDVGLSMCNTGIESNGGGTISINGSVIKSMTGIGISQQTGILKLRDTVIAQNGNNGLRLEWVTLDWDRVKVTNNSGYGAEIRDGCTTVGGGIFNLVVADNTDDGIAAAPNGTATLSIINSTIANNGPNELTCASSGVSVRNSIIWDTTGTTFSGGCDIRYSDVTGGANSNNNIDVTPSFVGSGGDPYALATSSQCKDKGSNTFVPATVTLDAAKRQRIKGAAVDMGAYEVQ